MTGPYSNNVYKGESRSFVKLPLVRKESVKITGVLLRKGKRPRLKSHVDKGQNRNVKEGRCTLKIRCLEKERIRVLFRFICFL